jgi:hypothetical protein
MAFPYLLTRLGRFEFEEQADGDLSVTVAGAYGRQSVESAVSCWLASEGELFAPKQPTHPGPLAEAIRRLRAH